MSDDHPHNSAILWHNSSTNESQIWYLHLHKITRRVTVLDETGAPIFVGAPWRCVGLSTFFRGDTSIVWHNNATGETQVWLMNNDRISGRQTLRNFDGAPLLVGSPWSIVALGIYDLERYLLWHNSATNETKMWFINPSYVAHRQLTVLAEDGTPVFVGSPWSIVGARLSIHWHNSVTNEVQRWYLRLGVREEPNWIEKRVTVRGENGSPIFVGHPWRVAGITEIEQDSQEDIVWHNSATLETQVWFMDGHDKIVRRATVVDEYDRPIFVGPPWSIVGAGFFPRDPMPAYPLY